MKILSVKLNDGKFEIKAEVSNGFLTETVTWYYTPEGRGHSERLDSDVPMNNQIGYLILGLMKADDNRLELDSDSCEALDRMEVMLG